MTAGQPPGGLTLATLWAELAGLRGDFRRELDATDEALDDLLRQVLAIEEVLAAPWWRRGRALRRWRADVRASVRQIEGSDFTGKRMNTLSTGWLDRPGARHRRTRR